MKILIIHNFYNLNINSGENVVVKNEMMLLRNAGHEVVLFSQENKPDQNLPKLELLKIGIRFLSGYGTSKEISHLLKHEQFDVCHIHNIFPLIGSRMIGIIQDAKIPIVHTIHNFRYRCGSGINFRSDKECHDCSAQNCFTPLIVHKCYRDSYAQSFAMFFAQARYRTSFEKISKFIALSPYAKKQLVASGIPENLVRIKPNFTNRVLTPKNGFAKSIIYAGRLENEKGLELLLKAWTDSNAGESGWTLKIAGSGSLRTKVEFYATQFREVQFLGNLSKPELTNEIAESSFSIFTSQMLESCPMQVIESLAVGTPVIYKPNESISDFMNTSYSIKLPENPEDWYLLFNKLNQMVAYEMSKASYIKYEQEFSPEVSLASLESIYLDAQALPNKS